MITPHQFATITFQNVLTFDLATVYGKEYPDTIGGIYSAKTMHVCVAPVCANTVGVVRL